MHAPATADDHLERIQRLESTLTDTALADRVEMTISCPAPDHYRVTSTDGSVEFRRRAVDGRPVHEITQVVGRNPIADQDPAHLCGYAEEVGHRHPRPRSNSYPFALESIAQFFDAQHAPDLLALHTASHMCDGQFGQHGSLGVVQARAPFIAAGAGIRSLGTVERATRLVDLAPTIATLMQLATHPEGVGPTGDAHPGALLRRQDGQCDTALLDGTRADHVVVLLLDGCNANLLHDVIDAGEAPNLARLVGRGTHYRHGSFASLPTATLANHTTAVTGAHPGHSGVLNHTWLDRSDGSTPDLLSMPQMFHAMRHLSPDVETLFGAVARSRRESFTCAAFEFCDTDADFSSFGIARTDQPWSLPDLADVTHVDLGAAETSAQYRFMTTVDHLSVRHAIDCWEQAAGNALPDLTWCSLSLVDEVGHENGPHGPATRAAVRDSDARIGDVVAAVERAGALDSTAFFAIADHGMEQCDPSVAEPWDAALAAAGVAHVDIGGGLIYLR